MLSRSSPTKLAFLLVLGIIINAQALGGTLGVGRRRLVATASVTNGTADVIEDQVPLLAVPEEYVVTNSSTTSFLEKLSNREKEVVFTTVRLPFRNYQDALDMMLNFCYHMRAVNSLDHLFILTTDNITWGRLHEAGMPVYLDHAFPERIEYIYGAGKATDSPNRVFDVQKHWWGSHILQHGFKAVYMDGDAVPLQDPFLAFRNNSYDVQGLSDWSRAKLPLPQDLFKGGCDLYYWIHDPAIKPTSAVVVCLEHQPNAILIGTVAKCIMSITTGLWYIRPTPAAKAFMSAMAQRLFDVTHQWDQTAWNEVILPFLWGYGDEAEQLKYRLLPHANYANVNVVDMRRKEGLPVDLVVLHSGHLHGKEKKEAYERLGYWKASQWAATETNNTGPDDKTSNEQEEKEKSVPLEQVDTGPTARQSQDLWVNKTAIVIVAVVVAFLAMYATRFSHRRIWARPTRRKLPRRDMT